MIVNNEQSQTTPSSDEAKVTNLSNDGSLPGSINNSSDSASNVTAEKVVNSLTSFGWWVFAKLQAAGEMVASVLGLDDSKYQYVIDSMTEEDWKIARAVEARRLAAVAGRPYVEMEGGAGKTKSLVPTEASSVVENRS